MFTWISRRLAAGFAAALMLTGCLAAPEGGALTGPHLFRKAPEKVAVAHGDVIVAGPTGYCVDRGASRVRGQTGFVLLASCASITRDPQAAVPAYPAVLTASVAVATGGAPATEATLDQLQAFITSAEGRATLARDGRAESVEILQSLRESRAVLLQLHDSSTNPAPGLDQTYWRGFFDLNGRLLTISVMSFSGSTISADQGLATLRGFLARIRAETASRPGRNPPGPSPIRRPKLFPRLFN